MCADPVYRLQVVAGILIDKDERVLITERLGDDQFRGMWEFPGGKIVAGESLVQALARELAEEIGVVTNHCEAFMRLEHDYPQRAVCLHFFTIRDWTGEPTGIEGQKIRWVAPSEIDTGMMLAADAPVIAALREC